jgi:adenine/guanine phosphoribosyltransferase-like PRPP-binding protein
MQRPPNWTSLRCLPTPRSFVLSCLICADPYRAANINKVACPESISFILGSAVAAELKLGLIPIRKAGKLPNIKRNVARQRFVDYTGESSCFEINKALVPKEIALCWLKNGWKPAVSCGA